MDSPLHHHSLRQRLLYFALVPAICLAVLLLGAVALRVSLQIEKARQQTVLNATLSLAEERVDRLDKMIIAQDNAVTASVDVQALRTIAARWLPTAARETPTVRAILVLDMNDPELEVRAFVSRAPGPADDAFRRMLLGRMLGRMELGTEPTDQLRHLHDELNGDNYLISYWQRSDDDRRYLVVAWHYVSKLVREIMPDLFRDLDKSSRMNVVDQQGQILFGPPIGAGPFTIGVSFPTTLYNWRLQVALTTAEGLERRAVRQQMVQIAVVVLAVLIAVLGTVIVVRASIEERRLAALKSDFVANVSHELKTPLSSVRMFGELLLTGRVASDEKRKEYLQIIVGESERLSSLIDNVLDFAKVERGKAAYEFSDGDIGASVRHAAEVLRYRAERQKVDLVVDAEPHVAVFDTRALELAVINLVDNALKYGEGTDRVHVQVCPEGEGGGVCVRVSDAGPGIPADEQKRIFDRFVRGHRSQEQHVRGSGIGLALVKHIAESHGGVVTVTSPVTDDGRGTAFELRLPHQPPGYKPDPQRHSLA